MLSLGVQAMVDSLAEARVAAEAELRGAQHRMRAADAAIGQTQRAIADIR
jgi:hypothetical protein